MDYEDIYLIINFETDDLAEQMIREEDEKYSPVPEDEYIDKLLKDEGFSIASLEGSLATLHNINKNMYVRFDINNEVYSVTPLEYIQPLKKYLDFVTSFNVPKKVKIVEISVQIGGIIDTNYGIKFKIQLLDEEGSEIYKSKSSELENNKNQRAQPDVYMRRKFGFSLNDAEYDDSINSLIDMMDIFFTEGLEQSAYYEKNKYNKNFDVFYTKEKSYHFGTYKNEYYAIVEINDYFFIYKKVNETVNIISGVKYIETVPLAIDKYREGA